MFSTRSLIDPLVISILQRFSPSNLFDYGCGDAVLSKKIKNLGYSIKGFDIDNSLIQKLKCESKTKEFLNQKEFFREKEKLIDTFDFVLCSLVLCIVNNENEVQNIIQTCYNLLRKKGIFILVICNPLYTWVEQTEIQNKILPENFRYDSKFLIQKEIKLSGNLREDVHRPLHYYEKIILENNFEIKEFHQTKGKDCKTGKFASDFLLLLCTK